MHHDELTGQKIIVIFILLVVIPILLFGEITSVSREMMFDILFGWISFLRRTTSTFSIRWDGVSVFAIAFVSGTAIAHLSLGRMYREVAVKLKAQQPTWKFRWTLVLMSTFVLLFVAGISFIGMSHQVTWLATSKTPLVGESVAGHQRTSSFNLKFLGMAVQDRLSVSDFIAEESQQSWVVPILPYLYGGYQSHEIDPNLPWDHPANASHFKTLVPELLNPSYRNPPLKDSRGYGLNHYAGNSFVFEHDQEIPLEELFADSSNLLLIGEVNNDFVPWGQPKNSRNPLLGLNNPNGFGGAANSSTTQFVMADGSVKDLSNNIDPVVLERWGRIKGR